MRGGAEVYLFVSPAPPIIGASKSCWHGGTKVRDFRNIPGIAGGSSTGEADVGGGVRGRRL
jgi:hypothetical protein